MSSVGYSLVSNYSTVQQLSPTTITEVEYVTIKTQPSGWVVSKTVQRDVFDKGEAGQELANFAQAVEQVTADPRVVAAMGVQSRELTGLYADNVVFTVQYKDPVHAPYGADAQATVGVGQLDFSDATIGQTLRAGVMAIIDATYANLQAAAGANELTAPSPVAPPVVEPPAALGG